MLESCISLDICLGFAAGLTDKDTGLVHLGYREYDPAIGRFITPDPLGFAGGDVDVYGYCLDDPINFYDRTGLAGKSEGKEEEVPAKVIKKTGQALWEIGSLAGRAGWQLVKDAGYEALKKTSPLGHPETKNEAANYAKKLILGETSLGQELVKSGPKIAKATKEAWNNMIEKEKEAEKHQDEINHKVYSSKWSDLYSKNSTLRKERAKAIQDAVSPSLKGIAKAYLDTPDDRFSLILPYLKQVNKEIKSDKANKQN